MFTVIWELSFSYNMRRMVTVFPLFFSVAISLANVIQADTSELFFEINCDYSKTLYDINEIDVIDYIDSNSLTELDILIFDDGTKSIKTYVTQDKTFAVEFVFSPDEIVLEIIPSQNGIKNGTYYSYYTDGELKYSCQYVAGIKFGYERSLDYKGRTIYERYWQNEVLLFQHSYFAGSTKISGSTYFVNGIRAVSYSFKKSGKLRLVIYYDGDEKVRVNY